MIIPGDRSTYSHRVRLLIKNGLVARIDGKVALYQTTPRGTDALWHFRELEELIAEFQE
jgi:hypothetical protein